MAVARPRRRAHLDRTAAYSERLPGVIVSDMGVASACVAVLGKAAPSRVWISSFVPCILLAGTFEDGLVWG